MDKNKFNKFYSKKTITQLIEQLRDHRIYGNIMDEEWFEALKIHLMEREISFEESQKIIYLLSDEFDPIKELEILKNQKTELDKLQTTGIDKNLTINPTKIISAGKNIKSIMYVILVVNLVAIISIWTAINSSDPETFKKVYLFLGAATLISSIIILFLLHSAGDNLENSVYKKEE